MVKKLRYYARFIVVCLLLKKVKMVRDLIRDLGKHIDDYTSTYEPEDQLEWSLVLGEIKAFLEADHPITILDHDSSPVIPSHRLSPQNTPPVDKSPSMNLMLQEILIVGNCSDQVKFSELTVDMFRILQTLEREPQEDAINIYDTSPAPLRQPMENGDKPSRRDNPHKYLLYKPSFSQLMVFLASGFKELPPNGALLLYISADGCCPTMKTPEDPGYDHGGVVTNSKRGDSEHVGNKRSLGTRDMHCLYPGDLWPFTRKPLFLVIDSDNSHAFMSLPRYFGQGIVALLSPLEVPPPLRDQQHRGSLFTLFLHSPLWGLCVVTGVLEVPFSVWDRCQTLLDRFMAEASRLITRARNVDSAFIHFFGDDFLRLLILRYVFCNITFRLHRAFKGPQYQSVSVPELPEAEVLEHPNLHRLLWEMASLLDIRSHFYDPGELD
ncbi:unnamed protein product [Darwinula stevensoni]|uniref:Protein SCAI n=1 Tax=Darwinula stevensoni TaxID=69355 RepID=A0A7R8XAG4_9CRUS|nr:unnamed protein product [Darwinula stevensoni]CAG0886669.1 unnamed protein product [Darwinula stevensoni]